MSLTFEQLREANTKRLQVFKNRKGEIAHSKADGSDWTPAQWLGAVVGELGEYANFRKKFERGDIDESQFKIEAANELADVVIYLDILAKQLGIDLGKATTLKFNEVSMRVGCTVLLSIIDQLSADEKWESADDVPVDGIYQVIGTAPFNGSAWTTVYVTHWRSLPPPSPVAKGAEA